MTIAPHIPRWIVGHGPDGAQRIFYTGPQQAVLLAWSRKDTTVHTDPLQLWPITIRADFLAALRTDAGDILQHTIETTDLAQRVDRDKAIQRAVAGFQADDESDAWWMSGLDDAKIYRNATWQPYHLKDMAEDMRQAILDVEALRPDTPSSK